MPSDLGDISLSTLKDKGPPQNDELESPSQGTRRASSPALSLAPSTYTYASSVDGRTLLRDMEGRSAPLRVCFPAGHFKQPTYLLPVDNIEHSRLHLQHELFKRKMGGLFLKPEAVRRALAPKQDVTPAIIDIGTGSGSWAIDMGRLFPHAEVTGLDLAPANLSSTPPPNCRFECDDVNLGLSHYRNSFDVVHCRLIGVGIKDYRSLLGDIAEMLRPGGVYLSMEVDMRMFNENCDPITAENEGEAERAPGGVDAGHVIPEWMKGMDCWEDSGEKQLYIPIGAWDEGMNPKQRAIAEMMKEDTLHIIDALRPLLISHGFFRETVNKLLANATDEVMHTRKKQYWKMRYAWGIKKDGGSGHGARGHAPDWTL
ncbi:hypothetical protein FRB96_007194 [Tulasnella sp. 330]|nr:hypothetical protein FRB96_007194 [Tulasnella sp. 330]